MALSARELLIIVRAQNEASGTLRRVGTDLRSLGRGGVIAGKGIDELARQRRWATLGMAGRTVAHLGRVVQTGGIIVGASLGFMARSAADFSSEVELAATQTTNNFSKMQSNSRRLMRAIISQMHEFPASSKEMTQASYDIFSSLDINLTNGIKLLKVFNKASVAGMTPLSEVAHAGITVLNDFGGTVDDMPKRFQRMFAAVRFGRMTFSEFTQTLAQTAPAFKAAGQSFDTLAGTTAFLTRKIPNVRMAGTALARMTEILGRKEFVQGAKEFGVTITDVHNRLLPLPTVIDRLVKRFPQIRKGGTDLQNFFKMVSAGKDGKGGQTGTIQARRAFAFLVLGLRDYHKMLRQVSTDNNEFTKSFKGMEQTPGVKWHTFVNSMKALALTIGLAAIPAIVSLTKPLQDAVKWFDKLDQKTKDQIGRWAVYSAGLMLLVGTIMVVVGALTSFAAMLGRFRALGLGFGVGALAILTVMESMKNGFHGLTTVITAFTNALTFRSGTAAFVAAAAIIIGTVMRIRRAMIATSAGLAVAGAGGSVGPGVGMLAATLGTPARIRVAGRAIADAYRAASRNALRAAAFRTGTKMAELGGATRSLAMLKGVGAGAAAGLAMVPGPLWLIAGALAAAGGAAILWNRHMDAMKRKAEDLHRAQISWANFTESAANNFKRVGTLGLDIRNMKRARISLADITDQIKQTKKELASAPAGQRAGLRRQLESLTLDQADAVETLRQANQRVRTSFDSVNRGIFAQASMLSLISTKQADYNKKKRELAFLDRTSGKATLSGAEVRMNRQIAADLNRQGLSYDGLRRRIRGLASEIRDLSAASGRGAAQIQRSFRNAVGQMVDMRILPKVNPRQIALALQTALRMGRMLTPKELKLVFRAILHPGDLRSLPARLRAALRGAQRAASVQVKVKLKAAQTQAAADLFHHRGDFAKGISVPVLAKANMAEAAKVKAQTAAVFKPPIHQPISLGPVSPNAAALGASIAAGIAGGVSANSGAINGAVVAAVNAAVAAGKAAAQAKSPSRKTMREIGTPMVQGIVKGIYAGTPDLEQAAKATVDLFTGAAIQAIDGKKHKLNLGTLFADIRGQLNQVNTFNSAMTKLTRRNLPAKLLDQLAALGVDGAKYIKLLANASNKQLANFVRTWSRLQAQIAKSARFTLDDLRSMVDQAAQNLVQKYDELRDNLAQWFNLFPQALQDMSGDSFKQAMDDYNSNLKDLQSQLADAHQQLADAYTQALDDAKSQMQQAMGDLFDFSNMPDVQTKIDWGIALNMADLQKQLQTQVDLFKHWRSDLAALAKRGVPKELITQLEQLGPAATGNLDVLVNSTKSELDKYVGTWQDGQAAIGDAAQQAVKDSVDLAKQTADILKQIADIEKQIRDLSKPHQMTPGDVIKALQDQQAQFKTWRDTLDALRKKKLPIQLLQQLEQLGPDALPMLQALNSMTADQLSQYTKIWVQTQASITAEAKKEMNEQIALWRKHGSNVALAIIAGVQDEQTQLLAFFRKLFLNLLKAADKTKKKTRSVMGELGDLGLVGDDGRTQSPVVLGGGEKAPINMTVHAVQSESLLSTLNRAQFRLVNRNP